MGCNESKQVRVQPVGPSEVKFDNTKLNKTQSQLSEYDVDENTGNKIKRNKSKNKRTKSSKSTRSNNTLGSCGSLDDGRSIEDSDRGFSAGSKFSKQSTDSGLGGDYDHVITENSDPDTVKKIENDFVENQSLDLGVTGTACQNRTSAKNKERLEEAMIMQTLREEGLITKPEKRSQAGTALAFEIIDVTNQEGIIRPPPRLAKLERRRKKKRQLTEEEIREKLEKAERRKKKKEKERLEKIKDHESKNNMSVNLALEQFEQLQKEKENVSHKKLDQVVDNREKRLREIREKMKERERRAELVRQRKEKAIQEGTYVAPQGEYPEEGK